jgi:hypothetical protein
MVRRRALTAAVMISVLASLGAGQRSLAVPATRFVKSAVIVAHISYHGWRDCYLMSNGQAEVVVVPAVGRVMQFRFAGDEDGPFFENRALDGKRPNPDSTEWANFGGDKTWPAPQGQWKKIIGREWPPPAAFDAMPVEASAVGDLVELTSALDPSFGIRATRRISLNPVRPVLTITTTYSKVKGDPIKVGVWVITQLRDPERAFMILPRKSQFPQGYNLQMGGPPKDVVFKDGMLSLVRDSKNSVKIGSDASTLVWMDKHYVVRIDSPRMGKKQYPNQGSSAEIYTNPDPLPYVELETEGPLQTLKLGDRIERTNTYTLMRRTETNPYLQARRALVR